MSLLAAIVAVGVAALGGLLGGGAVMVKWMDRGITRAQARKADIDNLRTIIDEVSTVSTRRGEEVEQLTRRVGVLEERERHMLTRAAVHEAWDQFAFAALVATNPQHPPPPPLTDPHHKTGGTP